MVSVWANKRIKNLLRVQCCEVMTSLRVEMKTELRHNMCDNITAEEECDIQHRAEKYLLIIILSSALFWVTSFLQINYILEMMFYDVNSAAMIIKQAFSIKFVNNNSSAAWESEDET